MNSTQVIGNKRKATEPLAKEKTAERRKITRACDSCKEKKTRCSGTLPCHRCTKLSRRCEYTALYTRGTPPSPLPGPHSVARQNTIHHSALPQRTPTDDASASPTIAVAERSPITQIRRGSQAIAVLSPRSNSPEPEATDLEGNYLGPSSGISFLSRSWRRLKQDDISTTPKIKENETPKNTPVLLFGDRPFSAKTDWATLELPPKARAKSFLDVYFDFSIVTYRFLRRGNVESTIDMLYEKNISPSNPPPSHLAAKVGVIFMIFAHVWMLRSLQYYSERWYTAARHMMSIETGPPALETIQVRLGLCLFLLSSSRANQCWYMFGTTMQLVTALGLHRRQLSKTSLGGHAYVEQELRKRIFWSAYTLDKYLSVMFGRPRLLDDEDIDQDLPDEVNDEDMFLEAPPKSHDAADCMMTASILHFRLGHITGEISRRVYPTKSTSTEAPYEAAIELVAELQEWKANVHPLFSSVQASSLIQPLRRQSHVLQLAYNHAMIHATRLFILNDFTDLSRRPLLPPDLVATHVQNCIESAKNIMQRVDALAGEGSMLESFWFTHYICFCAIIVAYIYTIQQHRSSQNADSPSFSNTGDDVPDLFSLAEGCQVHLAKATRKNCPSRRYGIILEELRLEVHNQLSTDPQSRRLQVPNDNRLLQGSQEEKFKDAGTRLEQPPTSSLSSLNYDPYLGSTAVSDLGSASLISDEEFNFLDNLDGSAWWTQLDSWLHNARSRTSIQMVNMAAELQPAMSADPLPEKEIAIEHVETTKSQPEPETIDGLVRHRAKLLGDTPIIFYPHSGIQYVGYSMRQLDVFAYRVAQKLAVKIPPRISSSEKPIVVSLLGPSDLNYLVTMLALSKLGHSVLLLSTRISLEAYTSLLEKTSSEHIIIHETFRDSAHDLGTRISGLQVEEISKEDVYNFEFEDVIDTNLTPALDLTREAKHVSWIIHSSGSTGLPKPIFQTQRASVRNYATNMNMRGFITLPLYHNHGISCLFRAIHSCNTIHLYNASLPLAKQYLLDIMKSHDFEIFYGVPYALKLLAEIEEGVQALAKLKVVTFGGSPCPDSLGEKLIANGVNLISHYGSTETGQLMVSERPQEDKFWDYLRPFEAVKPFLQFEERAPGIFELVVLDGWPSKVMSNRSDGSYATKDLFIKHPTLEAYKYYARLDDTIVLMNGEKVNPLELEGCVRQDSVVSEAIVFGANKASIGLIVIPTAVGQNLSRDQLICQIWPRVESAHNSMPAYGRLSQDMVITLPSDIQYPRTDKGTFIRQAVYRQFAEIIKDAYVEKVGKQLLTLSESDLKTFLTEKVKNVLPPKAHSLLSEDADFFNIGMDSLQATRLRTAIVREINTGGKELGLNLAFDYPTINLLAKYLTSLRLGASYNSQSVEATMQSMIEKYSTFKKHNPVPNSLNGRYVVITGASGSLGSHTAAKLASQHDVKTVYCLIRANSTIEAYERLAKSLQDRKVYDSLSHASRNKFVALPADLSDQHLGLEEYAYNLLTSQITDLIHCAWSVNFNWQLNSFEKDNIAGLKNLIDLCLKSQRSTPASFNFCSSISTVVNTAEDEIPENLPKSLTYTQTMGYAQSKLVAEHICIKAAEQTGIRARVLRVGQIIGDTRYGVWNTTEAIPLMLQSAVTIGALPRLDETHRWLPVDTVADILIDHSFSTYTTGVLNVLNHHSFHWTRNLMPFLHKAGLEFTELETSQWLEKLRSSNADPAINPPVKLVEFWTTKYGNQGPKRSFIWHNKLARQYSKTLDEMNTLDQESVNKMVEYFKGVW
ncbi:hypothetical protein BGW36DRAFT_284750 [Talaromyces proteolyticus]|uniref:Uncharacterized protein n=1 Tax=Talaromyces proteolyticus TaxID=1131652 RepID=A0AAD4Q5R7_9EURO|nr:uncharacterized protein BGW36DRAFT_284750 [Talaromyces proteolyticus]KAH8704891.1 hypothetical protein BGW36DRAFT_284750 [Talaromyces proteolyticus]